MLKTNPVIIASFLVALITFLFYLPVLPYEFIVQDDSIYIVANPLIRQLDWSMARQAFGGAHCGWWMPLTWISFAVDYHFWGFNPTGYHLQNNFLHALNAALVVIICDLLYRKSIRKELEPAPSFSSYTLLLIMTGLLFSLHPLRVESVAWIAERKDVLNGFFAFVSIVLYVRYVKARESGAAAWSYYAGALLCFALSLMAKGSSVGLSVMLLVLDRYPFGRLRRDTIMPLLLEKIPFLAVSAASALATIYFAGANAALVTFEAFPLSQRIAVSGNSLWEYWRLFFLPLGLTPLHVIPDPVPAVYIMKTAAVALLLAWIFLATRHAWLKATLLCFILPVLPVLGFFQNGDQAYAARFTYLSALAQSASAAALCYLPVMKIRSGAVRRLAAVVLILLLAGLAAVSVSLFSDWRNSESYWTSIIAGEPLAINYKERGRHYFASGRYDAAVSDFTAALERMTDTLKPYSYNLYGFRAEASRMAGRHEDAVNDFSNAIAGLPHPVYFYHRALALQSLGRTAEAAEDFKRSGPDPGPISWFE